MRRRGVHRRRRWEKRQNPILKQNGREKMGVTASCVFLWCVYFFFGLFPSIYVSIKESKGGKKS